MNKSSLIFEFMWIIVAIASLAAGIHQTFREGIRVSYIFFIFSIIGLLMFYLRRKNRKSSQN